MSRCKSSWWVLNKQTNKKFKGCDWYEEPTIRVARHKIHTVVCLPTLLPSRGQSSYLLIFSLKEIEHSVSLSCSPCVTTTTVVGRPKFRTNHCCASPRVAHTFNQGWLGHFLTSRNILSSCVLPPRPGPVQPLQIPPLPNLSSPGSAGGVMRPSSSPKLCPLLLAEPAALVRGLRFVLSFSRGAIRCPGLTRHRAQAQFKHGDCFRVLSNRCMVSPGEKSCESSWDNIVPTNSNVIGE